MARLLQPQSSHLAKLPRLKITGEPPQWCLWQIYAFTVEINFSQFGKVTGNRVAAPFWLTVAFL